MATTSHPHAHAHSRGTPTALRLRGQHTQSQTQTQTQTQTQPVLHLRGADEGQTQQDGEGNTRRRIQWASDVVDNEGLGRKKSKVCCIYHAPKGIDESSDESSSDDDDSSSDDDGGARPAGGKGKKDCGHGHDHGKGKGKQMDNKRSPNAYEKVPKVRDPSGSGVVSK